MTVPPGATEYVLAELGRRLTEVANRLEVGLARMEGIFVRKDVYEGWTKLADQEHLNIRADCSNKGSELQARLNDQARRIEALEEGKRWLLRAFGGSIVTTVISAFVAVRLTR